MDWALLSISAEQLKAAEVRGKCLSTEWFLFGVFLYRTEYGDLQGESPYSVDTSKYQTKTTPCFGIFHAVQSLSSFQY